MRGCGREERDWRGSRGGCGARGQEGAAGEQPEYPTSLSGVPAALRQYVQHLKRNQDRGCLPLKSIVRQLDTLNVLGFKDAMPDMSEADLLRMKVRQALERVDGQGGAVL